jgi:hypothetical protein
MTAVLARGLIYMLEQQAADQRCRAVLVASVHEYRYQSSTIGVLGLVTVVVVWYCVAYC